MDSTFAMCGKLVAQPGRRDELEALLLRTFDAPRMPGCDLYVVSRDLDHPDTLWVMELWRDADAHGASLQIPTVRDTIAEAMPLIAGMDGAKLQPVAGTLPA